MGHVAGVPTSSRYDELASARLASPFVMISRRLPLHHQNEYGRKSLPPLQRARECPRADDLIDLQLMVPAADRVLVRGLFFHPAKRFLVGTAKPVLTCANA